MMDVTFRKFTEDDVPLFYAWAKVPHVKNSWFKEGYEPEDSILNKVKGNGYDYPFVIEANGKPIGYMQYSNLHAYYQANPEEKSTYYASEPLGTVCVDLFIADVAYLNKGYGTEIVRKFSDWLLDKPEVKKLVIDPSTSNKRAIRCYEKAGFTFVRNAEDHVDTYHIMEKT